MTKITRTKDGVLQRHCVCCDAVVESTLGTRLNTRPEELVLCSVCGVDNSIVPSLAYRLRQGWTRLRRQRRVYGFALWRYPAPWKLLLLPREYEGRGDASEAAWFSN